MDTSLNYLKNEILKEIYFQTTTKCFRIFFSFISQNVRESRHRVLHLGSYSAVVPVAVPPLLFCFCCYSCCLLMSLLLPLQPLLLLLGRRPSERIPPGTPGNSIKANPTSYSCRGLQSRTEVLREARS